MSYTALEAHFRRLSQLEHVEAIASWDEAAMMPAGGGAARGAALATLKGLIHEESSAPRVGEWIAAAESRAAELSPWQVANLREIQRGYVRATALPTALVEASATAHSKSEQAWRKLREQVSAFDADRFLAPDIAKAAAVLRQPSGLLP